MFIKLFVINIVIFRGSSELFTSVSDGEDFLRHELYTINILEHFIAAEHKRILELNRTFEQYKTVVINALTTGLSNPVHFYSVIKKLANHWKDVKDLANHSKPETFQNITAWRKSNSVDVPTDIDIRESRIGLLRLQETYNLKPLDIADGYIRGSSTFGPSLDADDCYQMGLLYAGQKDYYNTLLWMNESMKRIELENPQNLKRKMDTMEHIAFSLHKQGNIERALQLTYDLLELDQTNSRFKHNIALYERILSETGHKYDPNGKLPPLKNIREIAEKPGNAVYETYKSLCRGEYNMNEEIKSKLTCYLKMNRPFLRLAPIKVEQVSYEPKILVFRQVLSDKEIKTIEDMTKARLKRATVNEKTGQCSKSPGRVAKSGWIRNDEHPIMTDINNRIDYMTDLDMSSAEALQIVNYGIGGHYNLHYDGNKQTIKRYSSNKTMLTNPKENEKLLNDRIATVLFYMSTPIAGGATIFPDVKLTLYPTKNDAIFWYNILKNGEPDMMTMHSGCPVLSGVKWVANKWIHEKGQEFRRQCSLNRHE